MFYNALMRTEKNVTVYFIEKRLMLCLEQTTIDVNRQSYWRFVISAFAYARCTCFTNLKLYFFCYQKCNQLSWSVIFLAFSSKFFLKYLYNTLYENQWRIIFIWCMNNVHSKLNSRFSHKYGIMCHLCIVTVP